MRRLSLGKGGRVKEKQPREKPVKGKKKEKELAWNLHPAGGRVWVRREVKKEGESDPEDTRPSEGVEVK